MTMETEPKSKLLFFQWVGAWVPEFLRLHGHQHVRCLEKFFDVTVIDQPCDYGEICDRHQPDLALFESGVYVGQRGITNVYAHPQVPKLGLCNCDAYCESREVFISDMASWGISTFFTHSVSMGEYTPQIAGNLFVWPNFADENLYRDYGESKVIPVLFTGSQASHYPWRSRICNIVSERFPSLICPHFGWAGRSTQGVISGEPYARMLNASLMVPSCGTIAKEVVRKHFEIPACRTCLVAEKTPSLQAAGFVDFQNCVFADETDVLDKLSHLFRHPDELQRITDAGYRMVHDRHTAKERDQIFQWFSLYRSLGPNERILQTGPFEPLVTVDSKTQIKNSHVISNGLDRDLLRRGDEELWAGKYRAAELLYLACLNYQEFIPEPKLRLAICSLYQGNVSRALHWVTQPIKSVVERYAAHDPDPVEWGYFVLCLLCQGKVEEASRRAIQFPQLRHPELDRMRFAVQTLAGHPAADLESNAGRRYSVHQLPDRSLGEWIDYVCDLLRANQQAHLAEKLRSALAGPAVGGRASELAHDLMVPRELRLTPPIAPDSADTRLRFGREPHHERVRQWLTERVKAILCRPLHGLERRFGYFLPYRYSWMKADEFLSAVRRMAHEADISTALLIGASAGEGTTEALIAGILENRNRPTLFCTNAQSPRFKKLQRRYAANSPVRCIGIGELEEVSGVQGFDLVLVDGSELVDGWECPPIPPARFVLLDDINTFSNHRYHSDLLADRAYRLLAHNPAHRRGYAIFKKFTSPPVPLGELHLAPVKAGND